MNIVWGSGKLRSWNISSNIIDNGLLKILRHKNISCDWWWKIFQCLLCYVGNCSVLGLLLLGHIIQPRLGPVPRDEGQEQERGEEQEGEGEWRVLRAREIVAATCRHHQSTGQGMDSMKAKFNLRINRSLNQNFVSSIQKTSFNWRARACKDNSEISSKLTSDTQTE